MNIPSWMQHNSFDSDVNSEQKYIAHHIHGRKIWTSLFAEEAWAIGHDCMVFQIDPSWQKDALRRTQSNDQIYYVHKETENKSKQICNVNPKNMYVLSL